MTRYRKGYAIAMIATTTMLAANSVAGLVLFIKRNPAWIKFNTSRNELNG